MSYAEKLEELQRLKAEVRRLERVAEDEARRMQPLTEADERRMYADQAEFDPSYVASGLKAPAPFAHERPDEFRRRLTAGLQGLSPRWSKAEIEKMPADAFEIASSQIRADAISNGKSHHAHGLRPKELKPIDTRTPAGHSATEFIGGPEAHFVRHFERPARRAVFQSAESYQAMARDATVASIAHAYHRPLVQAPRAAF